MKSFSKPVLIFAVFLVLTRCQHVLWAVQAMPRLGLQAWTFRSLPFNEPLKIANRLDIHYLQAYPGQKLGGDLEGDFHHTMDAMTQVKVLVLLKSEHMKLARYGIVNGRDATDWRQIFTFAKTMGVDMIVTAPNPKTLAAIEPLSREFGVVIARHNDSTPSIYTPISI